MGFKDILVHVDNRWQAAERIKLAALAAQGDAARLTGLHVRWQPDLPPALIGQLPAELRDLGQRCADTAAADARALFEAGVAASGLAGDWRDVAGPLADTLATHARYADLVVVGQDAADDDNRALTDALVLEAGRPVLVVPHAGRFDSLGQRVLVAWNGSREATRAVHDALPLLVRAQRVRVVAVNPGDALGDLPGADLCRHLASHGVRAECAAAYADDLGVGDLLLSRVADEDADLLVMGAYGRSRMRELVLGGATRHILRHMTVPVLLSH